MGSASWLSLLRLPDRVRPDQGPQVADMLHLPNGKNACLQSQQILYSGSFVVHREALERLVVGEGSSISVPRVGDPSLPGRRGRAVYWKSQGPCTLRHFSASRTTLPLDLTYILRWADLARLRCLDTYSDAVHKFFTLHRLLYC
jgi:hypothetical protein